MWIRDGKKSDPGSGTKKVGSRIRDKNIPDPPHWWILVHVDANFATTTKTDYNSTSIGRYPITLQYNKRISKESAGYLVWIIGVRPGSRPRLQ
jgi:hypothetical protein